MKLPIAYCSQCGDPFQPVAPGLPPVCNWCSYEEQPSGMLYGLIAGILYSVLIYAVIRVVLFLAGI